MAVLFAVPEDSRCALDADSSQVGPVFAVVVVEDYGDFRVLFYVSQLDGSGVGGEVDVFAVENVPDRSHA